MTEHNLDEDVQADVELAEKGPDFERRVGEPAPVRNRPTDPPEVAEEDTLIQREDLGPDSSTFIAAGSPIPPELRQLPRRAAREATPPAATAASSRKRG
jgi:hypothetical protein